MTGRPDVDTLAEDIDAGLDHLDGCNCLSHRALSDLAARARENEETEILLDAWKRDSEAYKDRWTAEQAKRRAAEADRDRILLARENAYERLGRAEADRDRLARRVAELEAALDNTRAYYVLRAESAERRVVELEGEKRDAERMAAAIVYSAGGSVNVAASTLRENLVLELERTEDIEALTTYRVALAGDGGGA